MIVNKPNSNTVLELAYVSEVLPFIKEASSDGHNIVVAHNLGYKPLAMVQWFNRSTSFSTQYVSPFPRLAAIASTTGQLTAEQDWFTVDENNITIYCQTLFSENPSGYSSALDDEVRFLLFKEVV